MVWMLLAALASPHRACADGDEDGCHAILSRSAHRWARGVVGDGPQEPWRLDEVERMVAYLDDDPATRCVMVPGAPACVGGVGEVACVLEGSCPEEEAVEPRAVADQPLHNPWWHPQTVVLTRPLAIDAPEPVDAEVEGWLQVARVGPPLWTAELPADGDGLLPGDILGSELAHGDVVLHGLFLDDVDVEGVGRADGGRCGWQVQHPDGRPAAGAWVYGDQVQQADERGLVSDCGCRLVAVLGEDAVVMPTHSICAEQRGRVTVQPGMGETRWRLFLEDGARRRCRVDGGDALWCDQLPRLPHPDGGLRFTGVGDDGVLELSEEVWRTAAPASPHIVHDEGMPLGRARSPLGPLCVTDGRWRPCTGDRRWRVVDEEGEPVVMRFVEGTTDLLGRLALPRGAERPTPLVPARVARRGRRIVVSATQPAGAPRRDAGVGALDEDRALELVDAATRRSPRAAAARRFDGGMAWRWPDGGFVVVALADADTAVVFGSEVDVPMVVTP